jgi:hypothetical protein
MAAFTMADIAAARKAQLPVFMVDPSGSEGPAPSRLRHRIALIAIRFKC